MQPDTSIASLGVIFQGISWEQWDRRIWAILCWLLCFSWK